MRKNILASGMGFSLHENDIEMEAVRSSGPGGQNVNKVSTKVVIHFNLHGTSYLSEYVFRRLELLFRKQINSEGYLVISSDRTRSQTRNREDCIAKLIERIREAAQRPKLRRPTKTPRSVKEKRLKNKKRRSQIKKLRSNKISRFE